MEPSCPRDCLFCLTVRPGKQSRLTIRLVCLTVRPVEPSCLWNCLVCLTVTPVERSCLTIRLVCLTVPPVEASCLWNCLVCVAVLPYRTVEIGGKTTSGNGQAWNSPSPRGQWRTGKNGGNWLRNRLWCPNDLRG